MGIMGSKSALDMTLELWRYIGQAEGWILEGKALEVASGTLRRIMRTV